MIQLIIAERADGWVLLKNGIRYGKYADLRAARDVAGMIAEQAHLVGDDCEMLVHQRDDWQEEACPGALRSQRN